MPEQPPPKPLFTTTRLVVGAIALAFVVWIGGSGCARADLERMSESEDVDGAIEALTRLSGLAKEVEAELQRARREADAAP